MPPPMTKVVFTFPTEEYKCVPFKEIKCGDFFSRADPAYLTSLYVMIDPELNGIGQCMRLGDVPYRTYFGCYGDDYVHDFIIFNRVAVSAAMTPLTQITPEQNERLLTLGEL